MRSMIAMWIALGAASPLALVACGKSEQAGVEAARREAEAAQRAKEAAGAPAKVIRPPVRGETKIACSQLIADPAAYQTALGEKEPLTVKDVTSSDGEATSSCSLLRGGKRPSEAEQKAILKREPRLGVLPGDELCNVTAMCSTVEDAEAFQKRCVARKDRSDDSMGQFACVQVVAQGVDDAYVFRFLDPDTKCVFKVRGGPSLADNELVKKCAVAARDAIGLEQIATSGAPAPAPATP